ncbi:protease modulator HflK, partial [Dickeya dadantii]|nr:protease modulator HflK [Dickeya dadantii]
SANPLRLPSNSTGAANSTQTRSSNNGNIMDQRKANAQRDDFTRVGRE